ncbi:MAG: copper resistance protein CopC [Dehalococcoidia bacterium]
MRRTARRKATTLNSPRAVRVGFPLAVALAGLVLSTGSAGAHANYERSEPGDGATVAESPERVDMWTSQEMSRSQGLPTMIVVNEAGDVVSEGDAVLDDADRTHMHVELPPSLPDKRYSVIWHTLSDEDGEEAQGAFHFFVGAAADGGSPTPALTEEPTAPPDETPVATASPQPTATPAGDDGDGGDVPLWALALGIVGGVVVGAVFGVVIGLRRER